ncbi:MAG: hypothetical protein 1 [Zeugodacus tau negev-like virus]|nr:MAG: hypothetical protein 1 [Zeugodacus tau negev-like virus]
MRLQSSFSELDISFTNEANNSHGFAAASRRCERLVLLNRLNCNLNTVDEKIAVKDIGGDIVRSVSIGEKNVHCCSPMLSSYDATRHSNRLYTATQQLNSGVVRDNYTKDVLNYYLQSYENFSGNNYFCFNKAQNCNIKSKALLFLHSTYDMSLQDIATSMDNADALVAYGSFVYSSQILTEDTGVIPWLNAQYKITRSKITNNRIKIAFGFKNDSGFIYEHNYKDYMALLTKSQFSSDKKNYYSVELLENRNGIQFFRINRLPYHFGKPTSHRLYLTHLSGKYLIRFPQLNYDKNRDSYSFPAKGTPLMKGIKANNDFWYNLPRNVEWIYFYADAEVVDRTCVYVLGATEDKFRPEHIVGYLRATTTRETMFTTVTKKNELPPLNSLIALAHAIYITLYHVKYIYGKALQQAKLNVNALRTDRNPENVLSEFDHRHNLITRFFDFIARRKASRFDPMQFIVQPSDYIEFQTNVLGDSIILNDEFSFSFVSKDIIVSEDLTNESLKYPNQPTPAKLTTVFPRKEDKKTVVQRLFLKLRQKGKNKPIEFKKDPLITPVQTKTIPKNTVEESKALLSDTPTDGTDVSTDSEDACLDSCENSIEDSTLTADFPMTPTVNNETAIPEGVIKPPVPIDTIFAVDDVVPVPPPRSKRSKSKVDTFVNDLCALTENETITKPDLTGEVYPRLGKFEPLTRLINVDGTRNECCFLAFAEDRAIDVNLVRQIIRSKFPKEGNQDLYDELEPGAFAGTAVLQALAEIYKVNVVIRTDDGVIPLRSTLKPLEIVRTINLVYKQYHYYYSPTCKQQYALDYRRHSMYVPLDLVAARTLISSVIDVVDSTYEKLKTTKKPGCFLVNNLSHFCNLHKECRNNDLLKYVNLLYSLRESNTSLCLIFERDNFDVDYLDELRRQYPDLGFRYVDVDINGYFAAVIHKLPNAVEIDSHDTHNMFLNHKCNDGKHVVFDNEHDIIYRCGSLEGNILHRHFKYPDLYIEIKKRDRDNVSSNSVLYVSPNRIVFFGDGNNSASLENSNDIARILTNHLHKHTPTRLLSVVLVSDYTQVEKLVAMLRTKSRYIYVKADIHQTLHKELTVTYFPEIRPIDYRKNAMLEAYQIWFYEKSTVQNQLSSGYQTMVNSITNGGALLSAIDNSMCMLDLSAGKFVRGLKPDPPYNWGFSSIGLFNTSALFTAKGELVVSNTKELMKRNIKYIVFNSASKLLHGITLTDTYSIDMVNTLLDTPMLYIQGVPGAGKTQYILDSNVGKTNNLILTVTREARDDMCRRANEMNLLLSEERIRTTDSLLINNNSPSDVNEVWLDEAFLIHPGNWCWISKITKCSKLIIVGDDAQIPYINRSGLNICRHKVDNWEMQREVLAVDHRNPLDVVCWLDKSKFYKFPVKGTSKYDRSVTFKVINGIGDIPVNSAVKYLTFTQSEKALLANQGRNVSTVHEYQGSQADHIYLVRTTTKDANSIYNSTSHVLVALTRHRRTFTYFTAKAEDYTVKQVKKMQSYSQIDIKSTRQGKLLGGHERVVKPDSSAVLYLENKEARNILLNSFETGYISASYYIQRNFPEIKQPLQPTVLDYDYPLLQDFVDRVLPNSSSEFREFDHDMFEYCYNRCNFSDVTTSMSLPVFKKYDRLQSNLRTSIQYPLHQSQKIAMKAFFERNGQVPQLQGLIDAGAEAQSLLTDFKRLCPFARDFTKDQIFPDISNTVDWLKTQPPGVVAMINAEEPFYDMNFSTYDFIIKTIPKIDLELGAEFRYKAPQTIAFQKKGINAVFCPILKEMMNRVEFSLNNNIVLYNRMSPQQFAQQFTEVLPAQRYQELKTFLEIDFSKYDKSQGLVILMFEALIMEWLGVPPKYIRIWIVMHRLTYINDRNNKFSATVEYQRKSGDAGTWRFNTIVQIAVLNRVYKLYKLFDNGTAVACFSGDDSLIFLKDPIPNIETKTYKLETVYNLEAKLLNYKVPYFCSKFLLLVGEEWIFVPDTMKLIVKLGRNDVVDYEHVECYRISFDDNLYYYKFSHFWPFISLAINDRYNIKGEHDCIYSALINLASDKTRFANLFTPTIGHVWGTVSTKPSLEL